MKDKKWLIVLGTAIAQLGVGSIYAWSIFNIPLLSKFHQLATDKTGAVSAIQPHLGSVSLIFSIASLALALSTLFVGPLVKRFGVKRVTMVAGIVFGISIIVSSFFNSPSQLILYYIVTGFIMGASDGIIYMATLSNAIKWFPKHAGVVSGISIAFYGVGSLLFKYVHSAFLGTNLAGNLPRALMAWGAITMILILVGALFLKDAPVAETVASESTVRNYTTREMLHTPQAFLLFICLLTIALSVYLIGIATNLGTGLAGLDAQTAANVVGLIAISNTVGRFVLGTLSDKFGRKPIFILNYVATLVAVAVLAFGGHLAPMSFNISMMIIGFFFGGTITVFPTIVADYYGIKNHSQNYAVIYLGYGIGSVSGAILLSILHGNVLGVFYVYMALLVLSLVMWFTIKSPQDGERVTREIPATI